MMKIYAHISSGKYHPISGEDFIFHKVINEQWLVAAVMDGCSSGKESHFASTAYGKSLEKSCRMLPNMNDIHPEFGSETTTKRAIGLFILRQLFSDVKNLKKLFYLKIEEILATIILLVYDLRSNTAWVCTSGDGVLCYNHELHEIDQHNMPDYLGYHLDRSFQEWYEHHTDSMEFGGIRDFSISTDGIMKLIPASGKNKGIIDPVEYLLKQHPENAPAHFISDRYHNLIENEDYIPYDDIGIIRVIP